jgi:hypothetical protein
MTAYKLRVQNTEFMNVKACDIYSKHFALVPLYGGAAALIGVKCSFRSPRKC